MPLVLWAEDNLGDQILIRESLEGLPHPPQLAFANDGLQLLEELGHARPNLVVLDLKMPRLGGIETLRRIRADPAWKDLPVVIFSAGNQPSETEECRALAVLDVVTKPVDFRLFSDAVRRIVRRAQPAAPLA